MSTGPVQFSSLAGLGGAAHLVQTEQSLAWDEFQRAVQSGEADEIRAARDHLIEVTR